MFKGTSKHKFRGKMFQKCFTCTVLNFKGGDLEIEAADLNHAKKKQLPNKSKVYIRGESEVLSKISHLELQFYSCPTIKPQISAYIASILLATDNYPNILYK